MKIDHIGYAVKDIDKAKEKFQELGFHFEEIIVDQHRNIYIAFGINNGYKIELVAKFNHEKDSPVDNILKKNGPTPYHICYRSNDFDNDIKNLLSKNFKVIVTAEQAVAFNNKRVVFLFNVQVGILEIVEQ